MMNRWLRLALFASLGMGFCTLTPWHLAAQQDNERIAALIKQLGSEKYSDRESATRELDAIGLRALRLLHSAAKLGNLEAQRRAKDLIRKLEDKLAADALLTPKMVNLSFKDKSVMQAVEELQKQSGYTIFVEGDKKPLHERKITLETGEITFWEAFDKLCEVGKLVETQAESPLKKHYTSPMGGGWQAVPAVIPPAGGQIILPPPVKGGGPVQLPPPIKGQPAANGQVVAGKVQQLPAPMPVLPPPQIQIQQAFPAQAQVVFTSVLPSEETAAMLIVRSGVPEKRPTFYCGALRVRLVESSRTSRNSFAPPEIDQALFTLVVSREPRLQQFSVIASPRIVKAQDNTGQQLMAVPEPLQVLDDEVQILAKRLMYYRGGADLDHSAPLRLKLGDKKSSNLKEVNGGLPVQALTAYPESFISVDDVMSAAGKSVPGKQGGMIELIDIAKQDNGSYSAKIRFQTPPNHFPAGNEMGGIVDVAVTDPQSANLKLQIAINALDRRRFLGGQLNFNEGLPVLVDAKGKVLKLHDFAQRTLREIDSQIVQEVTLFFRPAEGVGPPAQMVLYGHRMVSTTVPFRFENVPLP